MKPDLTRWNRAGLKRFRYVDGNAATYLEALRRELFTRLAGWDMELLGIRLDDGASIEDRLAALDDYVRQFGEDHQRAIDNYQEINDNRGSIALEMVRSFARASHVLTEHLDAYANEGFLGTATQWENVRRLVHGLDYHPAPPASAMTRLVIQAKPGQDGMVERGLQIRHTPEQGSPIVFETLEDILVDPALNALRPAGWNHSPGMITNADRLLLERVVDGLKPGDPVIVENSAGLTPRLIKDVSMENGHTVLLLDKTVSGIRGDLAVHLKPLEKLEIFAPLKRQITAAGVSALFLKDTPDQFRQIFENAQSGGEKYVFIGKGHSGIYKRVKEVADGGKIVLADGEKIYESSLAALKLLESDCIVGAPYIFVRLGLGNDVYVRDDILNFFDRNGQSSPLIGVTVLVRTSYADFICKISGVVYDGNYEYGTNKSAIKLDFSGDVPPLGEIRQILTPPDDNRWTWKMDCFIDMETAVESLKTGAIKRIVRGDLCVVACGSNLAAARVEDIVAEERTEQSILRIDWLEAASERQSENFLHSQTAVHGKFKERVRLKDADFNEEGIRGDELELENKEAAGLLSPGKPIVIEQETPPRSFQTEVRDVDKETGKVRLTSIPPEEYARGGMVIRANIVQAGHGETQPERILGSGNATLSNQEFLFPVSNVSSVHDPLQLSGIRADIRVTVDGELWAQVPRFNQSRPADPHYVVRMTEEGRLRVIFGDGVNGRRLPTGENNVRVAWRMGAGEEGNLDAGLLTKPAYPHPRVEAVAQPFRATGGSDMESVASLRRNAPASLSTMDRAVSVSDFAELAESHGSVWAARAELKSPCGQRIVMVTVVPAQGGELSDALSKTLKTFLLSRAIPGTGVELRNYDPELLNLDVTLCVDGARFDPDAVRNEVEETLLQRFALKNRAIGAPVYLSDVYQCVEATRGVEYSICKFRSDKTAHFLRPGVHGVLYMENAVNIEFTFEEAQK